MTDDAAFLSALGDAGTVCRKTARGLAEIQTREHRLPPRLRNALILVDGKRRLDELRRLLAPQADEALRALATHGLIEVVAAAPGSGPAAAASAASVGAAAALAGAAAPAGAAASASPPAAVPGAVAATASPASGLSREAFEAQRRNAVRALNDLLGPAAQTLALRMERARDAAEFQGCLASAVQTIASLRGAAAAQAYAARVLNR